MRYPKIIDKLNGGIITIIQLVLTIHNPIAFVKNYVRMNAYHILFQGELLKKYTQPIVEYAGKHKTQPMVCR
jgi:pentose-5-phosphate-3-epimerase